MSPEEKELLVKDLCGRLPYGVKINYNEEVCTIDSIGNDSELLLKNNDGEIVPKWEDSLFISIEKCKPYLFPLSSMTEEQKEELNKCVKQDYQKEYDNFVNNISNGVMKSIPMPNENVIEFYHKNYIDYRGLISKGLAKDATNLNVY